MKTDIKKWREILGKVTQGGWFNANGMNILAKDKRRSCVLTQNRHGFFVSCNKEGLLDIDSAKINLEFICKARNELPLILDELGELRLKVEALNLVLKNDLRTENQLQCTEKALELCKNQRNKWAKFGFNSKMKSWAKIKEQDAELDKIIDESNEKNLGFRYTHSYTNKRERETWAIQMLLW